MLGTVDLFIKQNHFLSGVVDIEVVAGCLSQNMLAAASVYFHTPPVKKQRLNDALADAAKWNPRTKIAKHHFPPRDAAAQK